MHQLLTQWAHPEFASIPGFQHNLESSNQRRGLIDTGDWTRATLPSWNDSILEGFRRPAAVLRLGPSALLQGLRETPTLMLMRWAFARGMMQFGVFRLASDQVSSELG
jgi:MPBQ/MSBQ methyltransferase